MSSVVDRSVDVDGRAVSFVEGGSGPAVLVVHGGRGWRHNLAPAVLELATDHHVIAPQMPGFGGSSGEGIETMREIATVLVGLMTSLGESSFSILGTSIGAIPALWAAIDHPDSVDKIVLEAPAAFRSGAPRPSAPREGQSLEELEYMMKVIGPETDESLVAAMPGCEVPALALFGADDPTFGPRFAPDYKLLPAASLAIVYAAGHDIKGERPAAFLSIVRDYLRRGPAFVVNETSTLIHA